MKFSAVSMKPSAFLIMILILFSLVSSLQLFTKIYASGGLALDGSGSYANIGGASFTCSFTTSNPNDVLIVDVFLESGTGHVTSVSSSPSLTWSKRIALLNSTIGDVEEWYATWSSSGAITVTVSFTGSPFRVMSSCFGVSGGNTASPFDSNPSIPSATTSSTSSLGITISTNTADDMIVGWLWMPNTGQTQPSGFTVINTPTSFGGSGQSSYEVVSSTLSSVTETWNSLLGNTIALIDALVPGPSSFTFKCTSTLGFPSVSVSGATPTTAGCSPSTTTTVLSAEPNATVTITVPTNTSLTSYVFNGAVLTNSSSCGCLWKQKIFEQFKGNYTMTPKSPTTWGASYSEFLTASDGGVSGIHMCSFSLSTGSVTKSCWADANSSASLPSTFASWIANQSVSWIDLVPSQHTGFYREMFRATFNAYPVGPILWDSNYSIQVRDVSTSSVFCTISTSKGSGIQGCSGTIISGDNYSLPLSFSDSVHSGQQWMLWYPPNSFVITSNNSILNTTFYDPKVSINIPENGSLLILGVLFGLVLGVPTMLLIPKRRRLRRFSQKP